MGDLFMSYTAIVIYNNNLYTSFTFDAPHSREAAYDEACNLWDKDSRMIPLSKVIAVIPGYHAAYNLAMLSDL